jgi:DNA polymerase V
MAKPPSISQHGGKRRGAGRPKGSNLYGESTHPVRLPRSMIKRVLQFVECRGFELPLYGCKVSAGFPSPADDYVEGTLDLNEHLIQHPSATFFVRVAGDSMIEAGIFPNDILIVDRSLEAKHGKVIIAILHGELTVKRLYKKGKRVMLLPENKAYSPITITESDELAIWGVVTSVIHAL